MTSAFAACGLRFVHHRGDDCGRFFADYLAAERRVLYVGMLGGGAPVLHFPRMFAEFHNVEFLFIEEYHFTNAQAARAERDKATLARLLTGRRLDIQPAGFGPRDSGRNAQRAVRAALDRAERRHMDVVIDMSGMGPETGFAAVRQLYDMSREEGRPTVHLVAAARNEVCVGLPTPAPGVGECLAVPAAACAVPETVWVPQLCEGACAALARVHERLRPARCAFMLPCASFDPYRADEILREFNDWIRSAAGHEPFDFVFADDSDPFDVFDSIQGLHRECHEHAGQGDRAAPRVVLSPGGSKGGSLGMLLAALQLELPVVHCPGLSYASVRGLVDTGLDAPPDRQWHFWLEATD